MAILGFELEEIVRLITLLEESGLDEMVFKEEGRYLRIRGPRLPKQAPATPPATSPLPPHPSRPALPAPRASRKAAKAPVPLSEDQIALTSPMVGTFYRAEKPGAAALVSVGQAISVGQTIGIIEAMKIFSEIPAEHAGIIVSIPAQDGQLVQAGTPLIILKKE
ncbi:MAG TPA: acetyl-CoA carboxylase biotin carboxyl carrier protein [Chthonomonadaceae bacterium]|nr:acetyl-CoA carboxylase biotin carboxyl carrier protein [Chthonomonadaceae bacterium]